eukprot:GHRQ01038695.1.p2 GENE.GHRQ01038695.1~~GHRQ01038695.1.p2  ORF type:complete len:105 (-),score=19.30 GHRQ01038695.1:315-629(-)
MHESGCVYRDNRLVNWDARLRTAVSDIEVDYIDIPGRTLINVPGYDKVGSSARSLLGSLLSALARGVNSICAGISSRRVLPSATASHCHTMHQPALSTMLFTHG